MPISRVGLFLCAALLWVTPVPAAQGFDASLDVAVPDGPSTVGDIVTVRVTARGGADVMWGELSVEAREAGSWAVVEGPDEIPGTNPPVWEMSLLALEVGELELPGISVSIRVGQEEPAMVLPESLPAVTVASVLGGEDDQAPAPLREPLGVHGFPWEWVGPLFVGLAPFVVLLALWWRRRHSANEPEAARYRLPPLEEFERCLEDVRQRIGSEPSELICDRLATGLRMYLERRSGEPAAEMTSHELRVLARREQWPSAVQTELHGVLGVADGVRFGRRRVSDAELMQGRDSALDIGRNLEQHFNPAPAAGDGS